MNYRVNILNQIKNFFVLLGITFCNSYKIDIFDSGESSFFRFKYLRQFVYSKVRHFDHAHMRLPGGCRVHRGLHILAGEGVKNCCLSRIRQPYDRYFQVDFSFSDLLIPLSVL